MPSPGYAIKRNYFPIYKDYLNSLVGLSWQAYQQGIEIKKKNDDENSNI